MSTLRKFIDTLKEDFKQSHQKVDSTNLKLIEIFPLETITSKSQYELALKILEQLITYINEEQSNDKGFEVYLKTLSELVGDYERAQFKTGTVSGVEMLVYIMDLQGLNQAGLSKGLGGQSQLFQKFLTVNVN